MPNIFIARQPIYDRKLNVYAYELLYRASETNQANVVDGDDATSQVLINALMDIGLPNIVGSAYVFINLTKHYILEGLPPTLAQDNVVLEVLEDILPDETLITALNKFKAEGYTIALDDFIYDSTKRSLIEVADLIKIDLIALPEGALEDQVKILKPYGVRLLAEKVETQEEFGHCRDLGFYYFQGYFFCKPNLIRGKRIPTSRIVIMQLLAELQSPELDFGELRDLISQDVSLSYRILRYINSAHFSLGRKIDSIRRAITLMGLKTIKSWVAILAMSSVDDKPHELILTALRRARMCETLAEITIGTHKIPAENAFIVGLFSTLDALLDKPLADILGTLPLTDEINDALLRHDGPLGQLLYLILEYEQGHWDSVGNSQYDASTLHNAYLESIHWADEISGTLIAKH